MFVFSEVKLFKNFMFNKSENKFKPRTNSLLIKGSGGSFERKSA